MAVLRGFLGFLVRMLHYKLTHVQEERWRVLATCLLLSAGLWVLRQMNKTYTQTLRVPITVAFDARNSISAASQPKAVFVRLKSRGWPMALALYGPERPRLLLRANGGVENWSPDTSQIRTLLQPKLPMVAIERVWLGGIDN